MHLDHPATEASLGELLYGKNFGRLVPKRFLTEKTLVDRTFMKNKRLVDKTLVN